MDRELLRPRTASQVASEAPLLPHALAAPRAPPLGSRRCWRLWLLRVLLLGGALYASLLVFWSASRLGLLSPGESSTVRFGAHSVGSEASDSRIRTVEAAESPPAATTSLSAREVAVQSAKALAQLQTQNQVKRTSADKKKKVERRYRCLGWRATGDCSPDGPRLPELDKLCSKAVPVGESGYCEVEDKDTGEVFHVLKKSCNGVKHDSRFRCIDASDFLKFPVRAREAVQKALAPGFALPHVVPQLLASQSGSGRDGIVMVVYPKLLASAYATIRTLRDVLGCQLPIEIWFRPAEMQTVRDALEPLRTLAEADTEGGIAFHEINDPRAIGYNTKVFALYHSFLERVLFLDADNVPVRDPSFLFESREFEETGAVFWPDFWHPDHTIFNIHNESLVWELLDLPFVDMFEQESGQLLIDRRRHAAPMEVLFFYAFHRPSHFESFKLAHGDKDLFRFAWMQQNASFHMIPSPPAVAGKVVNGSFCGMTMVQHDAEGAVLFLHRNSHKLTGVPKRQAINVRATALANVKARLTRKKEEKGFGRTTPKWSELEAEMADMTPAPTLEAPEADGYSDPAIWTHLLSFRNSSRRVDYVVETYNADPEFPKGQNCYGQRIIGSNPNFYAQEIATLSFAGLETELRRFAMEAAQLHQRTVETRTEAHKR